MRKRWQLFWIHFCYENKTMSRFFDALMEIENFLNIFLNKSKK